MARKAISPCGVFRASRALSGRVRSPQFSCAWFSLDLNRWHSKSAWGVSSRERPKEEQRKRAPRACASVRERPGPRPAPSGAAVRCRSGFQGSSASAFRPRDFGRHRLFSGAHFCEASSPGNTPSMPLSCPSHPKSHKTLFKSQILFKAAKGQAVSRRTICKLLLCVILLLCHVCMTPI